MQGTQYPQCRTCLSWYLLGRAQETDLKRAVLSFGSKDLSMSVLLSYRNGFLSVPEYAPSALARSRNCRRNRGCAVLVLQVPRRERSSGGLSAMRPFSGM